MVEVSTFGAVGWVLLMAQTLVLGWLVGARCAASRWRELAEKLSDNAERAIREIDRLRFDNKALREQLERRDRWVLCDRWTVLYESSNEEE
jgi:hypothetical protein